jgi:hypothetical protein
MSDYDNAFTNDVDPEALEEDLASFTSEQDYAYGSEYDYSLVEEDYFQSSDKTLEQSTDYFDVRRSEPANTLISSEAYSQEDYFSIPANYEAIPDDYVPDNLETNSSWSLARHFKPGDESENQSNDADANELSFENGVEEVSHKVNRNDVLSELGKWPGDAHEKWKNLKTGEREKVLEAITLRYGRNFANRFLEETRTPPRRQQADAHFVGVPWLTPQEAIANGYQLAQRSMLQEWWIDASGRTVYVQRPSMSPQDTIHADPEVDVFDQDPDVDLVTGYADDLEERCSEIRSVIKELHRKEGTKEYPRLYDKYLEAFENWQIDLHMFLDHSEDLRDEANPDNLEDLDVQIRRIEKLDEWRQLEYYQEVHGLPAPHSEVPPHSH